MQARVRVVRTHVCVCVSDEAAVGGGVDGVSAAGDRHGYGRERFASARARPSVVYASVCTPCGGGGGGGGGNVCCCLRVYRTFYTKSGLEACGPMGRAGSAGGGLEKALLHYTGPPAEYAPLTPPRVARPAASSSLDTHCRRHRTPPSSKDVLVRDHLDKHWLLNVLTFGKCNRLVYMYTICTFKCAGTYLLFFSVIYSRKVYICIHFLNERHN